MTLTEAIEAALEWRKTETDADTWNAFGGAEWDCHRIIEPLTEGGADVEFLSLYPILPDHQNPGCVTTDTLHCAWGASFTVNADNGPLVVQRGGYDSRAKTFAVKQVEGGRHALELLNTKGRTVVYIEFDSKEQVQALRDVLESVLHA